MRPVVEARINGRDGKLVVDSSSYYNVISGAGAVESAANDAGSADGGKRQTERRGNYEAPSLN